VPAAGSSSRSNATWHGGITGVGDLSPGTYDWSDPVVRIDIVRG
jgi:hypothetical protein